MLIQIRPGLWISAAWLRTVHSNPGGGCVVMDGAGQAHPVAQKYQDFADLVAGARGRMDMGACAIALSTKGGGVPARYVHALRAADGQVWVDHVEGTVLREEVRHPALARDIVHRLAVEFNQRAFPPLEVI